MAFHPPVTLLKQFQYPVANVRWSFARCVTTFANANVHDELSLIRRFIGRHEVYTDRLCAHVGYEVAFVRGLNLCHEPAIQALPGLTEDEVRSQWVSLLNSKNNEQDFRAVISQIADTVRARVYNRFRFATRNILTLI